MDFEIECAECYGEGITIDENGKRDGQCPGCEGVGTIEAELVICNECNGSGEGLSWSGSGRCPGCGGDGLVPDVG